MKRALGPWVAILIVLGSAALAPARPDKSPTSKPADDGGSFHKVKSTSGTAKTNASVASKFQVGSARWRLKLTTEPLENVPASSASARVALMVATTLDTEGKPANWQQVDLLVQGKAGQDVEREFDNGLDKNGKPNWFSLSVVGYGARYELTIEDQTPSSSKKKSSKKDD